MKISDIILDYKFFAKKYKAQLHCKSSKKYYEKNKEKIYLQHKRYALENHDRMLSYTSKYSKRQSKILSDIYVGQMVLRMNPDECKNNSEMIEMKRSEIKLKRLLKEKRNGNKE